MKRIFIIFLFLFSTEFCFAEVYKWVDEKGGVHFTDDFIQIPEKYRPKVEKLGTSEEKVETGIERESSSEKKVERSRTDYRTDTRPKEDTYRDRLGRGEEYWKSRIEEWNKKLKESQDKVNHLRIQYNELTEKFNESRSSAERGNLRKQRDQVKSEMDRYKAQIEEAKEMLEKKIPEEAEIFKAKREWIKQ